ncbi:deoxyribonuclease [Spirochaetia bacterium]|nr:deoxyribonuclease [Spirochaetia bacterium]
MKKINAVLGACLVFLVLSCQTLRAAPEPEKIRICSFNIQIFGAAKMLKSEVVEILLDIISQADLVAVQEVRSASPEPVEQFMTLLPKNYACVLGPREGRSSSKEQYWIIYDTDKLTVLGEAAWPDEDDIYERNPLGVYFQSHDKFDFILINNHLQPSAAEQEINALPKVIAWFQELWNECDVLVVGDFNADGFYYDESFLSDIFPEPEYKIIITNEYDTTVAESDNTYDRIIITSSSIEDYAGAHGVLRFDEVYDFSQYTIEPKEVSDHYPVWAEFFVGMDGD